MQINLMEWMNTFTFFSWGKSLCTNCETFPQAKCYFFQPQLKGWTLKSQPSELSRTSQLFPLFKGFPLQSIHPKRLGLQLQASICSLLSLNQLLRISFSILYPSFIKLLQRLAPLGTSIWNLFPVYVFWWQFPARILGIAFLWENHSELWHSQLLSLQTQQIYIIFG